MNSGQLVLGGRTLTGITRWMMVVSLGLFAGLCSCTSVAGLLLAAIVTVDFEELAANLADRPSGGGVGFPAPGAVEVSVRVFNLGSQSATVTVQFLLDSEPVGLSSVDIEPGDPPAEVGPESADMVFISGVRADGTLTPDEVFVLGIDFDSDTFLDYIVRDPPVDTDGDGVLDVDDNCPTDANADQLDSDRDGPGDACDDDDDNDGVTDDIDNCVLIPNADQADSDGDNRGDACDDDDDDDDDGDGDADRDGVNDSMDNCPFDRNVDQADNDLDGLGDVCDSDDDGDGVLDLFDNCPLDANSDQMDTDGDGEGDLCDATPRSQDDCNGNGIDDAQDIAGGTSADCNGNARPDECELADGVVAADDCQDAKPVCPGITYTGTTVGATADGPAGCSVVQNPVTSPDVWYSYTPATGGTLAVSLCDSTYDTVLTLHQVCPATLDNALACNDDSCGLQSELTLSVVGGQTYLIGVSGFQGAAGAFTMSFTGPACDRGPTGSDCDGNGVLDECDPDCDGDGIANACEIDDCTGDAGCGDCNNNGVPDGCDLTSGTSTDGNGNGVPDECDTATRLFVDVDASGGNTGLNWTDAYNDFQDALAMAGVSGGSVTEIWVADGTYRPAGVNGDRGVSFQLLNGVAVYGGFSGGETTLGQRDSIANVAILSGDLNDDDQAAVGQRGGGGRSDNSYHVVTGGGTNATARLDGFVITAGNADGDAPADKTGAGMLNAAGSPTVVRCSFLDNAADVAGGGMANVPGSSPMVISSRFEFNMAGDGGGMFNSGSSDARVINCLFRDNLASQSGGAICNTAASVPTLTNCTLEGNRAIALRGGGVFNTTGAGARLVNCVLWNNSDVDGTDESAQVHPADSSSFVSYSCVEGLDEFGVLGIGNVGDDPLFVDATAGDLQLSLESPCIDAADNGGVPPDLADLDGDDDQTEATPLDLAGTVRFLDDPTNDPDSGAGASPIVDMGAFEFLYVPECVTDADCDDGLFCTGVETCRPNGMCREGNYPCRRSAPACDESIDTCVECLIDIHCDDRAECTTDECVDGTCIRTPDDAFCDDGVFCNGQEICDSRNDCQAGTPPCPSRESCNERGETCGCVVYVDGNVAARSGDGTSWENAHSGLSDALNDPAAITCGRIWVAAGSYTPVVPESGDPRDATFPLLNNVAVYGGFVGGETLLSDRDPALNVTMLSGDLDGNDVGRNDNGENSYHVVLGENVDSTAVLDGFTITGGNADGRGLRAFGGGMFVSDGVGPTLINCTFSENVAGGSGGALSIVDSGPTLIGCVFNDNSATDNGGAIANFDASPMLSDCLLIDNTTSGGGGGLYIEGEGNTTLINCTLYANTATVGGGVLLSDGSATLTNCILWNNVSGDRSVLQRQLRGSMAAVRYSCVQDRLPDDRAVISGEGNIDDDPLFQDEDARDLRLSAGSPCIDAGDTLALPTDQTDLDDDGDLAELLPFDLDGLDRVSDDSSTIDTGVAVEVGGDVVDMGAYERRPPRRG